MGDVVVFGIDTQTVFLDDIMMDVPHAGTVTIPAEKALQSKDLWRAISQKRIFRLSHDPNPKVPVTHSPAPAAPSQEKRLGEMEAEIVNLRTENANLRSKITLLEAAVSDREKIDEILRLLRERPEIPTRAPRITMNGTQAAEEELVEVDAPAFVPAEIRPKDVETRIEVNSETSRGGSVLDAKDTLRRLRQGQ